MRISLLCLCALLTLAGGAAGQDELPQSEAGTEPTHAVPQEDETHYPVPPPLLYQGIYPCQACHRREIGGRTLPFEAGDPFLGNYIRTANPEPRVLTRMHRDVKLRHGKGAFWCLNCHSASERNDLVLFNGEFISFEESFRLCGQCHGSIYRDWKAGIHGRRVGRWDGKKLYLLCAHCHNPHDPAFRKYMGMRPPIQPREERAEIIERYRFPDLLLVPFSGIGEEQ